VLFIETTNFVELKETMYEEVKGRIPKLSSEDADVMGNIIAVALSGELFDKTDISRKFKDVK
jgi:hypothetical protein